MASQNYTLGLNEIPHLYMFIGWKGYKIFNEQHSMQYSMIFI